MTSNKQIEANKKNATKSTGPVTSKGKLTVAKNAIKHGLLSSVIVIDTDEMNEKWEDFEQLKQTLIKDLEPVGELENIMVDRIATTYWRMKRAIVAENGEIRKKSDNIFWKSFTKIAAEAERYKEFSVGYHFRDKLLNSVYCKYAKDKIEFYKEEVNRQGYLSEVFFDEYVEVRSLLKDKDGFSLTLFFNKIAKGELPEQEIAKGKKGLLFLLDKDLDSIKSIGEVAKELEDMKLEANTMSSHVPDTESLDKLTRYETTLENQLYKAINQLLKLQTLRKGGRVISFKTAELEGIEE